MRRRTHGVWFPDASAQLDAQTARQCTTASEMRQGATEFSGLPVFPTALKQLLDRMVEWALEGSVAAAKETDMIPVLMEFII